MTLANSSVAPGAHPRKRPAWLLWGKRILTVLFFIAVPTFLFFIIREVNWGEVKHAVGELKPLTIALGVGLALCSYLVYSCYDLLGRRYTGHKLAASKLLAIAFVCYAFTLNLGAWAGAFALRFRLYGRLGLDSPRIARIFTLNIITNWSGYMLLAGGLFVSGLLPIPPQWKMGADGLRILGVVLLLIPPAYLWVCAFARRRSWRLFGQRIELPSLGLALMQLGLSVANWSLMGLTLFVLLQQQVSYPLILGGLLLSSIAGAITHIPGGLGVLEAIFVALLQGQMARGNIIAALIGYRFVYYLIPLALACVFYLIIEARAKHLRTTKGAENDDSSADAMQKD